MDDVREVKLKRSDSIGLGFSVFGGKGSGFPPVIYQVVDESPAAVSGVVSNIKIFFVDKTRTTRAMWTLSKPPNFSTTVYSAGCAGFF
ncbi:uncharacterized protein TNCT_566481 [Trichonephila clavata]|uniref:Uncharacterized protein n=1 Tax=Trichonephila clavata TaxID=2740835 RepID=A0A8X6KFF2_TRICU|nr:uncharacterized protein TNCT_566481 [Trichonephila clavata]